MFLSVLFRNEIVFGKSLKILERIWRKNFTDNYGAYKKLQYCNMIIQTISIFIQKFKPKHH